MSPTKVDDVKLDESNKKAVIKVPEDQLSIAIGKGGQNVRLASKLSGYEIDIESSQSTPKEDSEEKQPEKKTEADKPAEPKKLKRKSELESSLLDAIEEHGE